MDARDEGPPVCPHCGSIMIVFTTKQSTEDVAVCLKCWAAITLHAMTRPLHRKMAARDQKHNVGRALVQRARGHSGSKHIRRLTRKPAGPRGLTITLSQPLN